VTFGHCGLDLEKAQAGGLGHAFEFANTPRLRAIGRVRNDRCGFAVLDLVPWDEATLDDQVTFVAVEAHLRVKAGERQRFEESNWVRFDRLFVWRAKLSGFQFSAFELRKFNRLEEFSYSFLQFF
jgi:hypothetical protein